MQMQATSTWLEILPPDVLDIVWFFVHESNMSVTLCYIRNMSVPMFRLWSNPSKRLLDLVTGDVGCLQHSYTDFFKFRNKRLCGYESSECQYAHGPCLSCYMIPMINPWTESPSHPRIYNCIDCKTDGFPCGVCACFFNGKIKPEIFHANF